MPGAITGETYDLHIVDAQDRAQRTKADGLRCILPPH
jgi:hypothetical protein